MHDSLPLRLPPSPEMNNDCVSVLFCLRFVFREQKKKNRKQKQKSLSMAFDLAMFARWD